MRLILGAVGGMAGRLLLLICLFVPAPLRGHAQSEDLDQYKLRLTGFWWFSQPSGYFDGKNQSGEFDLGRDFHFGSYSTFTGNVDWRFKRKHHLICGFSPVSYSKSAILLRTISFQGETYDIGTKESADIQSLSFAPGYQFDFIRRNWGYVALATQINLLDTKASLSGEVTVNGQTASRTASGSVFAPLPVLGPRARWLSDAQFLPHRSRRPDARHVLLRLWGLLLREGNLGRRTDPQLETDRRLPNGYPAQHSWRQQPDRRASDPKRTCSWHRRIIVEFDATTAAIGRATGDDPKSQVSCHM